MDPYDPAEGPPPFPEDEEAAGDDSTQGDGSGDGQNQGGNDQNQGDGQNQGWAIWISLEAELAQYISDGSLNSNINTYKQTI